ncbi:hypothetical protein AF435_14525 [Listeria monocytogenes]|nr:hypothetical protein [Listeria monocytogenes]EAC7086916.1 hypothetical protein [Listeria monocytogenes]EAC8542070.1 hypothetical protein [Listeria monocytogenes]EAC8548072.1 hypothetical protein [Listeria monocytogenes]EAC8934600.1 hypothetical protein [Listeria monocytogenes]
MWLLLFFSESKRELFSLLLSHAVNSFIAVLSIIFGIQSLLKGEMASGLVLGGIGLIVGGITIYLIQKSIRNLIHEKKSKNRTING